MCYTRLPHLVSRSSPVRHHRAVPALAHLIQLHSYPSNRVCVTTTVEAARYQGFIDIFKCASVFLIIACASPDSFIF